MTSLRTAIASAWSRPRVIRLTLGVESLHAVRILPTPGCNRRLHAEDTGAVASIHTRSCGSFKQTELRHNRSVTEWKKEWTDCRMDERRGKPLEQSLGAVV